MRSSGCDSDQAKDSCSCVYAFPCAELFVMMETKEKKKKKDPLGPLRLVVVL